MVADVDPLGAVTVWTATQALFFTRSEVCDALGLPEHQVRIVATPLEEASARSSCSWSPWQQRSRSDSAGRSPSS